ncbi:hypothetical protein GCM10023191_068570 [Actinoallomurus oryzae]|uniref:Uncharacterized protein n=1 Tax=Actinoallomurus oryzae TaxID=502180 RepID=A0ABP8QQZ4_9ACTN
MKHDELDRVVNALRPATVDELADAAYERRPDAALVRARAGTSAPSPHPARRRRPAYALGATAVAAAAAVLVAGSLSGGHGGARNGPNGTGGARTFLLASAETAARQPATHGTCWYSRTRMWQDLVPFKLGPGVPTPKVERRRTFQARTASSTEDWRCTLPGGTGMRFRTHLPLDVRVTFPTKKDEAAWKAAGSPPLDVNGGTTATKPHTVTYDKGSHLVNPEIGSHEIEWRTVPKLPATKSGLEAYLRRLWQQDREGGAHGYTAPADFGQYVFVSAWDLFMAPTTPGTRAALYRILADSSSVHLTGRIRDREGRSGVGITAQGTDVRLVVDPATGRLLDYEQLPDLARGAAGEYLAFERQGWVDRIGTVPSS